MDDSVHFLDDVNAAIFSVLLAADQPLSMEQLAQAMLGQYTGDTTVGDVATVLVDILPELRHLGLIAYRLDPK